MPLYSLAEYDAGKGCRRLDIPFGNEVVLEEGIRGAETTKGGIDVIEGKDMGARGVIAGTDAGMERFGILPMPRTGSQELPSIVALNIWKTWQTHVSNYLHKTNFRWQLCAHA